MIRLDLAATVQLTDPLEREKLQLAIIADIDLRHLPSRYVPCELMGAEVIAKAQPLDALTLVNTAAAVLRAVAGLQAKAKVSEN